MAARPADADSRARAMGVEVRQVLRRERQVGGSPGTGPQTHDLGRRPVRGAKCPADTGRPQNAERTLGVRGRLGEARLPSVRPAVARSGASGCR